MHISYNIHGSRIKDSAGLESHLKKLNPGSVLVLDNAGLANHYNNVLPKTDAIFRWYGPGDDNLQDKMAPAQWWAAVTPMTHPDVWLYWNNEPEYNAKTIAQAKEVIRLAVQDNRKVCILNLGVGQPEIEQWWEPESLELLQMASQHRDRVKIGLHEYFPAYPYADMPVPDGKDWRSTNPVSGRIPIANWPKDIRGFRKWYVGRSEELILGCRARGLKIRIDITEWFCDRIRQVEPWLDGLQRDPANRLGIVRGFRTLATQYRQWWGLDLEEAAWTMLNHLRESFYNHYSEYENAHIFSLGNGGENVANAAQDWRDFDVERMYRFYKLSEEYDMSTSTPPVPAPEGPFVQANFLGTANYNIRSQPDETANNVIGKLTPGMALVMKQVETISTAGKRYPWAYVKTDALEGWVALIRVVNGTVQPVGLSTLFEFAASGGDSVEVARADLQTIGDTLTQVRVLAAEIQGVLDRYS